MNIEKANQVKERRELALRRKRERLYAEINDPVTKKPFNKPLKIMSTEQIKESIKARPDSNQDIKFLDKKTCGVCLSSWKEILLEGKHLVFTKCGHIYCRDCAGTISSQGNRECSICRRSLRRDDPKFRRLHLPLDPKLKKKPVEEKPVVIHLPWDPKLKKKPKEVISVVRSFPFKCMNKF